MSAALLVLLLASPVISDATEVPLRSPAPERKIEVRIALGYKDARPDRFVGDRFERMVYLNHLTSACHGARLLCAFQRARDDADRFEKRVVHASGEPLIIRVILSHSSVSADDRENRGNPFQRWQSRRSEENFRRGLISGSIVIYNGHSRDGGGPDFRPPRLLSNRHVDYSWYREFKPGFADLLAVLETSANQPKALGLFSCSSQQHFTQRIHRAAPQTRLMTVAQLLYYTDALKQSLNEIEATLSSEINLPTP